MLEDIDLAVERMPLDDPFRVAAIAVRGIALALAGQTESAEPVLNDAVAEWERGRQRAPGGRPLPHAARGDRRGPR